MIVSGAGVRQVVYAGGRLGGHVGSDQERAVTDLQVFERQFLIDQFFM